MLQPSLTYRNLLRWNVQSWLGNYKATTLDELWIGLLALEALLIVGVFSLRALETVGWRTQKSRFMRSYTIPPSSGIYDIAHPDDLPSDTEIVDCTDKIISPGFIDTHRHGWQTALKTLIPNTTLPAYLYQFAGVASSHIYSADDVYLGQLTGLLEALNAGVTTSLDHAHHIWSKETADAGFQASVDSGARVYWCHGFITHGDYSLTDQIANFRKLAKSSQTSGLVTVGAAFDGWTVSPPEDVNAVVSVIKETKIPVLTTHYLGGPWMVNNSPELFQRLGLLDTRMAVVFSHATDITATEAKLLRSASQFISITPESEMHYGHGHATAHLVQEQASLGVDTFSTFSTDLLTQARLWLQRTRSRLFDHVLAGWKLPANNPMSANQAFLLATRQGARALRRPDLGVLRPGAKADLVVFDGRSPGMLGWRDPVAAVVLHAGVGDIEHVLVDGKFRKRDGKLTYENYDELAGRFLASAERLQKKAVESPAPVLEGRFWGGCEFGYAPEVNISRGSGTGYGKQFLEK
ncbi:Metallo-dependent hydrolase [Daldinia caldariorum]|uniref:Metallo-dependent hydrolase n=1 Tax=Daldinia caldariorum TaxID=326644 RepID=UPI0020074393|nr:Metallo-dependent hydrolase [Daldinia caldariorum]KAI1473213.1 Metallo-dependent hydrolase [Daldinia caldariorum]